MAVKATPVFVQAPLLGMARISTANIVRDGSSGALGTVVTAGADGARVELVRVVAVTTTTPGTVRLFLSINGGTNKFLWAELAIPANTVSASNPGVAVEFTPTKPLMMPASALLYASTEKGETFDVHAHGGQLS